MKDLANEAGIPVKLDEEAMKIVLGKGLSGGEMSIRTIEDMQPVLLGEGVDEPKDSYFMYRDVFEPEKKPVMKKHFARYDITLIPNGFMGEEFIKTFGHYHPNVPGQNISYPEVYEVISGQALYLLQKVDAKNPRKVVDFAVMEAKEGDKAVMPPSYGHVTINNGDAPLVMSNWVDDRFESEYGEIKNLKGFAWYFTKDETKKNELYEDAPEPRYIKAESVPDFGLISEKPMYKSFFEAPEKFGYLGKPQDFMENFNKVLNI